MLTRRNMLLASIAAGVLMHNRDVLAKAAQPSTPVNFEVPAGACDCHTHIHGDRREIPVLRRPRLHAGAGLARRDGGAAQGAAHGARGGGDAERLRHRQFLQPVRHDGPWRGRARRRRDRRQDAGERTRCHAQGRLPRHPAQSRDRRHQRSQRRPRARSGRHRARQGARLACPDLHESGDDHGRSRRSSPTSPVPVVFDHFGGAQAALGVRAAGLCRSGGAGEIRQGLCEDFRRLSRLETRAGLCRLRAAREGADRRQRRPHRLGHRLAASGFGDAARQASRPT